MTAPKTYVGIDNDINGGMTDTGKIIRNGWVFGLIPETETCEGWVAGQIEELWRKNNVEWEKYGFQVGQLPDETGGAVILPVSGARRDIEHVGGKDRVH